MKKHTKEKIRVLILCFLTFISGYTISTVINKGYLIDIKNYVDISTSRLDNSKDIVYFDKDVLDLLESSFRSYDSEYFYCLNGVKKNNTYYITRITETKIIYSNESTVVHQRCDNFAIAGVHSHPTGTCQMSDTDIENLEKYREDKNNEDYLGIVQCSPTQFGIYGKDSNIRSLAWKELKD